jgi:uncharacterized protein YndB with AHSA1/START domain
MKSDTNLSLVVRKTIAATPETLFDAWTKPSLLMKWWGPKNVTCIAAEIDLKIGGIFSITNQLADGKIMIIHGVFEHIKRPDELIYSWNTDKSYCAEEKVTVWFKAKNNGTEVVVNHERISSDALYHSHELGWQGCLAGLNELGING